MFHADVPPRIDYKLTDPQVKGKSLLDLQMAPSVVFLVRWQNTSLNGMWLSSNLISYVCKGADVSWNGWTDANKVAPIRPDLLALAEELPKPPSFDPTPEELAAEEKAKSEAIGDGKEDSSGKGKTLGGAKAPKWLKGLGGKK